MIVLLLFVLIVPVPPLAVDMAYNSGYYFPDTEMLSASLSQTVPQQTTLSPKIKVEIGPITYQEKSVVTNNQPSITYQIKPQLAPEPKKLVCKAPRPLIQGSGTVRECEWE